MNNRKYKKILVTGGAGFIGSFLVDKLIEKGFGVKIYDNLEKQVHQGKKPPFLNPKAEFIMGDVRDYDVLKSVCIDVDVIFHLASAVGVAQSNYEIKKYVDVNTGGSANILDILVNCKNRVKKFITISSMTGYGEGNYLCKKCGIVRPGLRTEAQLIEKDWDLYCPNCQTTIQATKTDETALDFPNSIYGFSKKTQQDMALIIGKLYNIPTVVLRGFNIYGPRQSLSNPYTGVTAIFISRIKNNKEAIIFEDGAQTRDFVSVHDVVDAFILALEKDEANYNLFNIGSGRGTTIIEISETLSRLLGKSGLIKVNQEFRKNDIRHCFADITKARKLLRWEPKVSLEEGFRELIEWSKTETAEDNFEVAQMELKEKGIA